MFVLIKAEENLGMVMVFTIISAVQEKLTHLIESAEQRRLDEANRLVQEKEEAEQVIIIHVLNVFQIFPFRHSGNIWNNTLLGFPIVCKAFVFKVIAICMRYYIKYRYVIYV